MRQIFRYALLTLVGILIGLALGHYWIGRTIGESSKIMSAFLALKEYEVLTSLQYKESDLPHGRQALGDLLSFMEKMEDHRKLPDSMRKGLDLDRGITYMRLALLEENAGNQETSLEYVRQAQETLKRTEMKDVSEDHLRDVVGGLDATTHYLLPYTLNFRMMMP